MCQLLALSARTPQPLTPFLPEFFARGGVTDRHADGWGAAFFEPGSESSPTLFREELPAGRSEAARALAERSIRARTAFAHVRAASVEPPALANTHPFSRSSWGREVVFAHNGWLKDCGVGISAPLPEAYRPRGRTDSEYAFGRLMMDLEACHPDLPSIEEMTRTLARTARELAGHGNLNMVLSDGRALWARCADDLWLGRSAEGAAIVATAPLAAGSDWKPLEKGRVRAFVDGEAVFEA